MKKEFEFDKVIPAEDITDYLRVLVDAFEKGVVTLNSSEGSFCLKPSGLIHLEVEAVSKKDKEKFELKFSWRKDALNPSDMEKEFYISSEEIEVDELSGASENAGQNPLPSIDETASEDTIETASSVADDLDIEHAEDHATKKPKAKK
jgi:amphi-Trp domain-containing protein